MDRLASCYYVTQSLSLVISWTLYLLHLAHLVMPIIVTIMSIASLVFLFCVHLLRRLISRASAFRVLEHNIPRISNPYLRLTETELLQATAYFSDQRIIGKGRFGTVYRGILPSGRTVALKRMKLLLKTDAACSVHPSILQLHDPLSNDHFLAELHILGQLRHRNVMTSLGYFFNDEEMIIISKFMPKRSLDILMLHRRLGWKQRLNIAVGMAHGLAYLHHECRNTIVHCDQKPANVLLDKNLELRTADFGVAKIINDNQITESSLGPRFTVGYTAPERAYQARPSPKGDVYSFGIMLLELVSGVRPTSSRLVNKGITFTEWVKSVDETNSLTEMLDDCLKSNTRFYDEIGRVIKMGILCTHENPNMRPEMKDLVAGLMEIKQDIRQFNIPISVLVHPDPQISDSVTEDSVSSSV